MDNAISREKNLANDSRIHICFGNKTKNSAPLAIHVDYQSKISCVFNSGSFRE